MKIINPKEARDAVSVQYSQYLKEFNYSKKIGSVFFFYRKIMRIFLVDQTQNDKKNKKLDLPNKLPLNCEIVTIYKIFLLF